MPDVISVIAIAMEGAIVAMAIQAFINIARSWEKISRKKVVVLKLIFALAMGGKAISNAMFEMPLYDACTNTSHVENALYHISMITANWILLSRASIVLISRPKLATTIEYLFVLIRICGGLLDFFKSYAIDNREDGTCIYLEYGQVGIFYSSVDLFIDIYVTITITIYLYSHSSKLNSRLGGLYGTIVGSNLLRTFILVIFNLATLLIDLQAYETWQQLVWQATTIAYILTVAYDADMVKLVARLQSVTSSNKSSSRNKTKGAIVIIKEQDISSVQLDVGYTSDVQLTQLNELTPVHLKEDIES